MRVLDPDNVTVVITDSGLGGLSTTADLYRRLKKTCPFQNVHLIYFNSLADISLGYNDMKSTDDKVAVFNNALYAMYELFHPDYIVIACNTLSVIHEQTEFTKSQNFPVVGIVDTSVNLILNFLRNNNDASIIIFGTETTIASNHYPKLLIEKGIESRRIITEPCSTLHLEIEKNPQSNATKKLISHHVSKAIAKLPDSKKPFGASLNCTHYGYAEETFKEAFGAANANLKTLINPNVHLSDFLFENGSQKDHPNIFIEIVSQAEIPKKNIESTSRLIKDTSPEVATALKSYKYSPNLFEWSFAKK